MAKFVLEPEHLYPEEYSVNLISCSDGVFSIYDAVRVNIGYADTRDSVSLELEYRILDILRILVKEMCDKYQLKCDCSGKYDDWSIIDEGKRIG
jgi:hypothetical protein